MTRQYTETAEDIVNDSFISLLENLDKLDNSVMKAYLATTVKNKCLNHLKRRTCEQMIYRELKSDALDKANIRALETTQMDFRIFNSEVTKICRERLSGMGPLTMKIFTDRMNGKSYKEIAETYGITQRTVTYEISKALAVLKDALKDYLPALLLILCMSRQ